MNKQVHGFQDEDLSRHGEKLNFATVISCLYLYGTDSYGCLYLELIVCKIDLKILVTVGGLQGDSSN